MNDSADATMEATDVDTGLTRGLTAAEAAAPLERYGPNALAEKKTGTLERLKRCVWAPIPWMIDATVILSEGLGDRTPAKVFRDEIMAAMRSGDWFDPARIALRRDSTGQ